MKFFGFLVGCHHLYMLIYHITVDIGRHGLGSEFIWPTRLSVPRQCSPTPNPRKKMVHGTGSDRNTGRNSSLWIHLHRNVNSIFYVYSISQLYIYFQITLGISFLRHFGPTRSTTCMASCFSLF